MRIRVDGASVTQELAIEMESKIHNRWISISNIFSIILILTILIVIFAACVTQRTGLHCKYAELDNKTAHFTIFQG